MKASKATVSSLTWTFNRVNYSMFTGSAVPLLAEPYRPGRTAA